VTETPQEHRADALVLEQPGVVVPKGLKEGAVGLGESTAVGLASTAPAYSLAATLVLVVLAVGYQTPLIFVLAFIPMFLSAWAAKEMNRADPDCGTSFTWAARALGVRTGWFAGGWGTIAADFLAMASYAQIAGQYVFLFFGADKIGTNPTSVWVLAVGVLWIVVLTYLCYRGIEVSARLQVVLVVIEMVLLVVLAVYALVRVAEGHAPAHVAFSWSWFDPAKIVSFNKLMVALVLAVFIYWGWDTTTSINEESEDPSRVPGLAGVISTFMLLGTYLLVVISLLMFAGAGPNGVGLGNEAHEGDSLSVLGNAIFGGSAFGQVMSRLLIFMVLSSAVATTQTTILPNARTTLSMAFHESIPKIFGRTHPRYMTPTFSTISFGVVSVIYYTAINFISGGSVIEDAVTATSIFAALYLGITGASAAWHYRGVIYLGFRATLSQIIVPALAAITLFAMLIWSIKVYLNPEESSLEVKVFGVTIGGVLLVTAVTALAGLVWMLVCERVTNRGYFKNRKLQSEFSLTEEGEIVSRREDAEAGG